MNQKTAGGTLGAGMAERLLAAVPEPMFVVDEELKITHFNDLAAEITGCAAEDAIGRPCRDVFHADLCDDGCVLRAAMDSGSMLRGREARLEPSEGQVLECLVSATPLVAEDGAVLGGVEVLRDVTAERKAQRDVERKSVRIEEYHQASMELAMGLSECFQVLAELREGNYDIRVSAATIDSGDELMANLGKALNQTIEQIQNTNVRVDEYHEASLELAMGISECFQVLAEVRAGNLSARVSEMTETSSDELMANLAQTLNATILEIQEQLETIARQQMALQELSTPILQLWDNVIALPVIGVVDTRRAAEIMERLLDEIVTRQSKYLILDITGVEVVDTRIADHFVKVIKAAQLLGASCVLTGIRPAVAQTLVDMGVDLSSITTVANLRDGLKECLWMMQRQQALVEVVDDKGDRR